MPKLLIGVALSALALTCALFVGDYPPLAAWIGAALISLLIMPD